MNIYGAIGKEGETVVSNSAFAIQQIAINFLEFKRSPEESLSGPQLEYLNNLKDYIRRERILIGSSK